MAKLLISMFVLLYSGALMAATAIVQTVTGNVTAVIGTNVPVSLTQNAALESGMTVTTGTNSRIVMKFEDGQVIALNENTAFKIGQYHFDRTEPKKSSMFFSLLKGALRSVSGLIGQQAPGTYRLQTPVATIGIRGTDFMAATGSLYLQVINGAVSATSSAGTTAFTAGQTGFVSTLSTLPTAISAAQLPGSVAASFSQLSSMAVTGAGAATGGATSGGAATGGTTAGGAAAGGSAATGAAVGGMSTMAVVGTAAAVAAVAVVATNNNTTAATTTVTQ